MYELNSTDSRTKTSQDDGTDGRELSPVELAGLRDFHEEQSLIKTLCQSSTEEARIKLLQNNLSKFFPEDWQMSQFWYDSETTRVLSTEFQRLLALDADARIAFVSCPSVFRCCYTGITARNVDLYEFDRRFEAFGSSYHYYDYNFPETVPEDRVGSYSAVLLDPPFLSEECLERMAVTVKLLGNKNAKVMLCTAATLEDAASKYLGLSKTYFIPKHIPNGVKLRSEFACFTNYDFFIH